MAYDYSQAGYSPDITAWLDNLVAQRQALQDKYGPDIKLDNPEWMYSRQVQDGTSDSYSTVFTPEDELRTIMSLGQDAETIFNPGYNVWDWGGSRTPGQFDITRLTAGNEYTFTDNNTGQTYTATTPEQLKQLTQIAQSLSGAGNNVASWDIRDSGGSLVASDTSYSPDFWKQAGQMAADALPAAFATMALGPGAGWALTGLTAGGATAAYQGAKGASLEDSLLAGLQSGLLSAGMAYASPYINAGFTDAGLAFPGMDTVFSPTYTGAFDAPSVYTGAIGAAPGVSEAFQVGALSPSFSGFGGLTAGALSSLSQLPQISEYNAYDESDGYDAPSTDSGANYSDVEGVVVPGTRLPTTGVSIAPIAASATPPRASSFYPQEDVLVSSTRPKDQPISAAPIAASALTDLGYDTGEQLGYGDKPTTEAPKEEGTDYGKYLDYAALALKGLGILGPLLGGSSGAGSRTAGTTSAGFGRLPDSFSAKLPTGSAIPAYGGGLNRRLRDLSGIDWKTYGFRPGINFYENVPMATGGSLSVKPSAKSFAVRGAGDGRSDDIPAVLSDGEYVIDAETVALLGNGSNKAGAAQLDRFRANIRKHKGKEMAKGRFSANAKKPQAYLAGGRT